MPFPFFTLLSHFTHLSNWQEKSAYGFASRERDYFIHSKMIDWFPFARTGDSVVSKTDRIPAFIEFISYWVEIMSDGDSS
jgi:hypothetical protein